MRNKKASFSYRSFVSVLLALCFLGLAVSGVVIYFAPPCSIAESTGWTVAGLSKVQWSSLHQVMALIIIILSLIHLFIYNWKTFLIYFRRNKIKKTVQSEQKVSFFDKIKIPKEVFTAVIAAIILYAGALTLIAPFGWLHDTHDAIKDSYRESVDRPGRGMGQGDGVQLDAQRELQIDTIGIDHLLPDDAESLPPDTLEKLEIDDHQYREGRGEGQRGGRGLGQGDPEGRGLGQGGGQGEGGRNKENSNQ